LREGSSPDISAFSDIMDPKAKLNKVRH